MDELQHARFVLFLKQNYLYFIKQIQSHLNKVYRVYLRKGLSRLSLHPTNTTMQHSSKQLLAHDSKYFCSLSSRVFGVWWVLFIWFSYSHMEARVLHNFKGHPVSKLVYLFLRRNTKFCGETCKHGCEEQQIQQAWIWLCFWSIFPKCQIR